VKIFAGFRANEETVTLPASLFAELLPLVDDLGELKVTLACLRLVADRTTHFVRVTDLLQDSALAGLGHPAVRDGLERAVTRGALLRVYVERSGGNEEWYFANTPEGRAIVTAIQRGESPESAQPALAQTHVERANIFGLYEQVIGTLSPLIADELRDAEATYPAEWIDDAFREAARQNVRSWAYVRKILERRGQRDRRHSRPAGNVSDEWEKFMRGKP
jgi:hypothetical protein